MKKQLLIFCLAAMVCIGFAGVGSVDAAEIINLTAMPPGSLVNACAVGISNITSKYTDMNLKVIPKTNERAWVPLMATGEADLGLGNATALRNAFLGVDVFEEIGKQVNVKGFPLRLVTIGSPIISQFTVRGDDPAQKISDLKGYRMPYYPDGTFAKLMTDARLANGGLTVKDIKPVLFSNPIEACKALIAGRTQAADIAIFAPIAVEAVSKVGMRYIPLDVSPEALARYKAFNPTFYAYRVPGGVYAGIPEPMWLSAFDIYYVARTDLDEEAVYTLTKTLWERNDELVKSPGLAMWKKDRFVTDEIWLPYHPGAIKFYKEVGVWTDKAEELQQARLAEAP